MLIDISECACEGISERDELLYKGHTHHCRWHPHPVEGLNRTKMYRVDEFALCLSWDVHLLMPLDISTLGC